MRRFSSRDIVLYLLLILMVVFTFTTLQRMDQADAPIYSEIRAYFLQERVSYFTLKDSTLTLTVLGTGDQTDRKSVV